MLESSTIGYITTDMAQHRLMAILLFVCLSLCFEVAQSQLQPLGGPCVNSTQCQSECCFRSSPQGSGECIIRSSRGQRCYGPNDGNLCFSSKQCNSGCCYSSDSYNPIAVCGPEGGPLKCVGPDNGDRCVINTECNSGCCRGRLLLTNAERSICQPRAAENATCDRVPFNRRYRYCPCETGLTCQRVRNNRFACKKPSSQ